MPIFHDENLSIDWPAVRFHDVKLVLTRKEFELLAMLAQNEGETIRREVLLQTIWGYRSGTRTRTLDVHVRRLRRKLGDHGEQYIQTIFGVGYRFARLRPARALVIPSPVAYAIGA
ncbi:MAG: winged helix-turn-helix transcriptional regulator [Acidobacteriaceae bacterium]|jgi:DNA-binding response OmpR family regulator|nr:winged helix-turn-helix transcriptional regulator [Acidobacteriaceae bacterium]